MWTEAPAFLEDLCYLSTCDYIPWSKLNGKTIFITGATGLIGYTLTSTLLYYEQQHHTGINIIALVRNVEEAKNKFKKQLLEGCKLELIEGSIESKWKWDTNIDYIIHGACPTASAFFAQRPVETIDAIVFGTRNILEFAREKEVLGCVCLSSMEVFGKVDSKKKLKEDDLGYIDLFSPRSSYPEGKRLAEMMCCAYAHEYKVPVTVARLAQTFGPGVSKDDQRVFAYMARCAIQQKNICLKASGSKENMYLYTADAVGAILLLLLKGEKGSVYNVGNPETYCSVKEMGILVSRELSGGTISVITNTGDAEDLYPPDSALMLDISNLKLLGWRSSKNLIQIYKAMISSF